MRERLVNLAEQEVQLTVRPAAAEPAKDTEAQRDPAADLAFGYVMNQMGPRWQNPRTRALIDAAYACL